MRVVNFMVILMRLLVNTTIGCCGYAATYRMGIEVILKIIFLRRFVLIVSVDRVL